MTVKPKIGDRVRRERYKRPAVCGTILQIGAPDVIQEIRVRWDVEPGARAFASWIALRDVQVAPVESPWRVDIT